MKPDPTIDYYGALGVEPTATETDVKKAYHKLALKCHPDRNPGDEEQARARFTVIGAAYEVLVNSETRIIYDQERRRFLAMPGLKPMQPTVPARKQYTAQNNPYTNTSSFFPPPPKAPTAQKPPTPVNNPQPGYNRNRPTAGQGGWSTNAEAYERTRARYPHQSPHREQFPARPPNGNPGRSTNEGRPVPPPPPQAYSRVPGGGAPPQAFSPDHSRAQSPESRRRAETFAAGAPSGRPTPFGTGLSRSQSTRAPPGASNFNRSGPPPPPPVSAYSGVKGGVRFQTTEGPPPPPRPSSFQQPSDLKDPSSGEDYLRHHEEEIPQQQAGLGSEWDRVRAPYATPGGEKTAMRFGSGLEKSKSNQDSPKSATRPGPSNLRRSGSLESLTTDRMRAHSSSNEGTPNNHVSFGKPSIRVDPRQSYSANVSPHRPGFQDRARSGDATSEQRSRGLRKSMAVDSDDSEPAFSGSTSSLEENIGATHNENRPKATNSRINARRRPPVSMNTPGSRPVSGTDYRRSSGTDSEKDLPGRTSRGVPHFGQVREQERMRSSSGAHSQPQPIPSPRLFGEQVPPHSGHGSVSPHFSPPFGDHLAVPGSPRYSASGPPPPPLPTAQQSQSQAQTGFSTSFWPQKVPGEHSTGRNGASPPEKRPAFAEKRSDSGLESRRRRDQQRASRRPGAAPRKSGRSYEESSSEDWSKMDRMRSRSAEGHSPSVRSGSPMNIDPVPPAMMQNNQTQQNIPHPPPPPSMAAQSGSSFASRQASANHGPGGVPPPPPANPPSHRHRTRSHDLNFDSLNNVGPLGRSGNGIMGMDDLKADLPFESRPSSQHPNPQRFEPERPNPPKPPRVPEIRRPIANFDDWTRFSSDFNDYIKRFGRYDVEMLKVMRRKQEETGRIPGDWPLGLSGQHRAARDYYFKEVQIERRLMMHRAAAWDRHEAALETYARVKQAVYADPE